MCKNRYGYLLTMLIFLVIVSIACNKDDVAVTPVTLPADIYTIVSLLDIGNNGNASDIKADLKFLTTVKSEDIVEVRLILVKSSKGFSVNQIKDLKPGNYATINLPGVANQTIKLNETIKDSDGDAITNGINYTGFVGILGKGNTQQLSASKEILLTNKATYIGNYVGTWEDLGPPGPAKFDMSMRIYADNSGKMFYANAEFKPFGKGTEDATVKLSVNGDVITSFVLSQNIKGYNNDCVATSTLTGKFEEVTNLVLNTFVWDDCDGKRSVRLMFKRID